MAYPSRNITSAELGTVRLHHKGQWLVGELKENHRQVGCATIKAGTRFVCVGGGIAGPAIALFPVEVDATEAPTWANGHLRAVPKGEWNAVGRITG